MYIIWALALGVRGGVHLLANRPSIPGHYYALEVQFYLDFYKIVIFPTRLSVGVTCPKEQRPGRVTSCPEK